jgi:molybdopterin/thiamine biosynthesis adenylyltransferase
MSTQCHDRTAPSSPRGRALLIGLGGLGCPAALALVRAGVRELVLCDDDVVDEGNLHRQILYQDADIGADKLDAARAALSADAARSGTQLSLLRERFLPDNARAIVRDVDLVIEGADNFATKFLVADACFLERRPVVHGAAIRWVGTAWAVASGGRPCYRCLFEEVPSGPQASCDSAGVMGPVVGFVGALMAELALRTLAGAGAFGELWSFDGKAETLRRVPVAARPACPLCGAAASIGDTEEARYLPGTRAA